MAELRVIKAKKARGGPDFYFLLLCDTCDAWCSGYMLFKVRVIIFFSGVGRVVYEIYKEYKRKASKL